MTRKISFLLLTLFLIQCSTVPISNRKRVAFLPEAQLVSMATDSYQGVLNESEVIRSGEQYEMIQRVGNRIKEAVFIYLDQKGEGEEIRKYDWEFNLIDEDVVNAWAMPGGKVAFYTGILPICEDETGVAVVMGHEIAHVVARHGNERMSQGVLQQSGGLLLEVLMEEKPETTKNLFRTAYGLGSTVAGTLPFSRLHETEADELGLIFMAIAGYDPAAAAPFWGRMSAKGGGNTPEFLSTHPSSERRAKNLRENLPKAQKYYEQYKRN